MTNEQTGIYPLTQSIWTLIRAMGMLAENQLRAARGEALPYGEEAFYSLLKAYIQQDDS